MAEEKKLSNDELEQAAGGKAFARPNRKLQGGGTVVPSAGGAQDDDDSNDGPTPSIGDVTPMDDPSFQ